MRFLSIFTYFRFFDRKCNTVSVCKWNASRTSVV